MDVCRVADIILTMNRFMLLADATNGEKYRKYMESGGYFVMDITELRTRIRNLLKLRSNDMTPNGKMAVLLDDYMVRKGIVVLLNPPDVIQEYVGLVGADASMIRVVDLREINEVYYSDFCKNFDVLMGKGNDLFLYTEKVLAKFGKK